MTTQDKGNIMSLGGTSGMVPKSSGGFDNTASIGNSANVSRKPN